MSQTFRVFLRAVAILASFIGLPVLTPALVLVLFSTTLADTITIVIDFDESGLSTAERTAIYNDVVACYGGIPGSDTLRFTTQTNLPVDGNKNITVEVSSGTGTSRKDGQTTWLWGRSHKKSNAATVYLGEYTRAGSGHDFTPEQRRQSIADTIAHELGHTLCAMHKTDTGVDKPETDKMRGAPSDAVKKMANRMFGEDSKAQIARGIAMFNELGGLKWKLGPPAREDACCQWVTGVPTEEGVSALEDLNSDAMLSISGAAVDFGWINFEGNFFKYLPSSQPSMAIEFQDGDAPNFAIRTIGGNVFDTNSSNFLGRSFGGNVMNESSAVSYRSDYYSEVTYRWDLSPQGQGTVSAHFVANQSDGLHGFGVCVPEPSAAHLLFLGALVWNVERRIRRFGGPRGSAAWF